MQRGSGLIVAGFGGAGVSALPEFSFGSFKVSVGGRFLQGVSMAECVEPRVNSELEDLLEWLEIEPVETEYAGRRRVLESLLYQEREVQRAVNLFKRVLQRSRDLLWQQPALPRRKKLLESLLSPECSFELEFEAEAVRELVLSLSQPLRREWSRLLGISRRELEHACYRGGAVTLELAGLLACREGIGFIARYDPAALRLCGVYSLRELEARIAAIMVYS